VFLLIPSAVLNDQFAHSLAHLLELGVEGVLIQLANHFQQHPSLGINVLQVAQVFLLAGGEHQSEPRGQLLQFALHIEEGA
jgi:hypothetical protein